MLTGTKLMNELVDELNELKLSTMAATLDDLYHRPGFLEMDRLTMIAELIGPQFQEKVSTTLKNRLTAAHLKGLLKNWQTALILINENICHQA